jgi:hypothetical protein
VKDLSTTLLGYSTKRLSKTSWAFGLGAKSLLATGVDFYTGITEEYSFHVYKDHVVSAIAKFEDDIVNEVEIFFEGLDNEYSVYYRKTRNLTGYYRNRGKTP